MTSRAPASRRRQSGQALIETAVTLPILLILFFGFLAAGVGAQGYVDMNTAVYLAAASNVTAYADDQAEADQFASDTFTHTVAHDPLVEVETAPGKAFECGQDPGNSYAAGGTITCRGSAYLRFSKTLLGWVVPVDPEITAQASAIRSPYRSQKP
jgi:hypothetical protein